jgi:cytochrome c biogenesis protein ResB
MSQHYPDINSPQFGQQACSTIVELVLGHLPLGIKGSKIDDRLALDILCYASVKRISIEIEAHQLFELYRRRFGIETSYRQLHQVRARTIPRNPALRLLVVGLALLIVNLWVLLRRTWVQMTRYGKRVRVVELTLERVADALVDSLKQLLGVIPFFQVKAVLHATKLFRDLLRMNQFS